MIALARSSGFMIWHRIVLTDPDATPTGFGAAVASAFGFGLPLTVTNDVYSLGLVLDADVTVTMAEGAVSDSFKITVYDLPEQTVQKLQAAYQTKSLAVTINIGYFDSPSLLLGSHPVMKGIVTKVTPTMADDGRLQLELSGLEVTGYALLHTEGIASRQGTASLDDMVRAQLARVTEKTKQTVTLAPGSTLHSPDVHDFTVHAGSVLSALAQLSDKAQQPLVVGDGVVQVGPAVGSRQAPVTFDPDVNLVKLGGAQQESSADDSGQGNGGGGGSATPGTAGVAGGGAGGREVKNSLTLTVLGHPGLRVGQLVTVTGLRVDNPNGPRRIVRLTHQYSTTHGYVCEATLADLPAGRRFPSATGAAGVVDEWNRTIAAARQNNPTIDVGEVTSYSPGSQTGANSAHRTTLRYPQVPAPHDEEPSVGSVVSADSDELHHKPMVSAFAFDKVGLVTPVYPGMRAVLLHNRNLTNDALVAGWLWPSNPASTPPPNHAGDYWLALPTGLDAQGKPTGKGVHDLTDARGARVIHARALHLLVGQGALDDVGTRPGVPDDDTITIEHASGTTIKVDSQGAVSITTSGKRISLGNGSVSVAIDGTSVAVS
jgi:hypothetical protein